MNCLICRQAQTIDGLTPVVFERGEMKFVVINVPARVCPNCGDAYLDESVAERLMQGAEKMPMTGELNAIREYESLWKN